MVVEQNNNNNNIENSESSHFHQHNLIARIESFKSETASSVGKKTFSGYVYTIPDSWCADTKTISDKASVHKGNADFGAVFTTERRCAASFLKVNMCQFNCL